MSRKAWIKNFNGKPAIYAGLLPGGLLKIRVGESYVMITAGEWAALPLA